MIPDSSKNKLYEVAVLSSRACRRKQIDVINSLSKDVGMMQDTMRCIPFVLRLGRLARAASPLTCADGPSNEDTLPAAIVIDGQGHARPRRTMVTDVQRETADDN